MDIVLIIASFVFGLIIVTVLFALFLAFINLIANEFKSATVGKKSAIATLIGLVLLLFTFHS